MRPFPCRDFKPPPSLAPASCSGAASCAASDTLAARPASGGGGCEKGPYRAYRVGGGGVGHPSRNPRSPARSRALRRWRSADPAAVAARWLRRILSAVKGAAAGSRLPSRPAAPASDTLAAPAVYKGFLSCRRLAASLQAGSGQRCRPGQPPAAAASTAGDRMAVQGVSCRRWRCWPSVQESPFSGEIQGVEAVEVGGSCRRLVGVSLGGSGGAGVGWLAPWLPSFQLAPAPANGVGCSLNGGG